MKKQVGVWRVYSTDKGGVFATTEKQWTATHYDAVKIQSLKSLPKRVRQAMVDILAERYGIE